MAGAISRRKLADVVAERLLAGDKAVLRQLAAYLIETRQTRTLDLVVRDIEHALAQRGTLVADVTSARPLSSTLTKQMKDFLADATGATTVQLRTHVDASLLGGVAIATPQATLDTSIKAQLQQLRAAKQQ